MKINIQYPPPRRHRTVATSLVADSFGITGDGPPLTIARDLNVPLRPGHRVAITGPSGSGKSSLLRAIADQLEYKKLRVARPGDQQLRSRAVIDGVPLPFHEAIRLLTSCGLCEPTLLMRSPDELSEGQRWRLRLALALACRPDWLLIDEFASTWDDVLARVIAANLRRQSLRGRCGLIVATCHAAPIDDLDPDLRIDCNLDGAISMNSKDRTHLPCPRSRMNSTSHLVPKRTGRISLAGITAQNNSAPSE